MMIKNNRSSGERYKSIGLDYLRTVYPAESKIKPPRPFDYLTTNNSLILIKSKRISNSPKKYIWDFYPEEIKALAAYNQLYFIDILLIVINSNRTRKQHLVNIADFRNPFRSAALTNHSRLTLKKEARFY